ncbi:MAG: outer membrane protein assembly factor BamA [Candidatus Omnitrophota bacterium]|nr:outer membrane protein assembly factor BamA [Candidatus Omnitrophota bacterium]
MTDNNIYDILLKMKSFNLKFKIAFLVLTSAVLSAALFSAPSYAEEETAQKIIKYVDVKDNKTVSGATILSKLKTKKGDMFSQKVVDEDIKRLYLLGFFSDVSVAVEDVQDGVGVIFTVTEKAPLTKVSFTGNRVFNAKRLEGAVESKLNEFADDRKLKKDADSIKDLYQKKGYPWAEVTYEIKVDENNALSEVVFEINEGARAVVKKIDLIGNTAFSDKRIAKIMKSKTAGFFRSGVYKKEVLEDDMERIKNFYKQAGYLDIKPSYELVFQERRKKKWIELVVRLEEGRKYVTGAIKISGNSVFSEEELKALLKMKPGDTFTEEGLHTDVGSAQEHYFDKGYIMARVRPDTVLNMDTDRVDITYTLTEGEVAYVNKINIRGNTKTKDVVVRRELRIKPGEKYDGAKLRRSKERLYNLGYFEDITFDTQETSDPAKRDMIVDVKETKTGEFSFGGGFSSIDKLVGFMEIEQRNFDMLNFPTFTGDGQDIKLRGEFGSTRRNYLLSWTEPWIFDKPLSFGFDLYASEYNRSGSSGYAYDETRQGGDIRFGKEFSETFRGDLTYRIETVDIADVASEASSALKAEEGENTISSAMFQLTKDTTDNKFNPVKGVVLIGSIEVAGGPLAGDKDFAKFFNSMSHYSQLGPFVLELKLRDGVVSTYGGDTGAVPVYERFFAGGTYTIRGYKERGVGPMDQSGDSIGGGTMAVGNAELTFSIIENLKGAFFVDAGNVWYVPDSKPRGGTSSGGIKVGVGTGVRIKTPIGPVKLDYGFPVNADENQDDTGRIHFSMTRGF